MTDLAELAILLREVRDDVRAVRRSQADMAERLGKLEEAAAAAGGDPSMISSSSSSSSDASTAASSAAAGVAAFHRRVVKKAGRMSVLREIRENNDMMAKLQETERRMSTRGFHGDTGKRAAVGKALGFTQRKPQSNSEDTNGDPRATRQNSLKNKFKAAAKITSAASKAANKGSGIRDEITADDLAFARRRAHSHGKHGSKKDADGGARLAGEASTMPSSSAASAFFSIAISKARPFASARAKSLQRMTSKRSMRAISNTKQAVKDARETLSAHLEAVCNIYNYAQDRPKKTDDSEGKHWSILLPSNPVLVLWQTFIMALIVMYMFKVPVRLAFYYDDPPWEQVLDTIADTVFIVDILINFRIAYHDERSMWVLDGKKIAWHYARTWLVVDLIASIPFTWIQLDDQAGGEEAAQINKLLRLLRIFKLLRVFRFQRYTEVLPFDTLLFSFNPSFVRSIRSLFFLLVSWHFIACLYWVVVLAHYGDLVPCSTIASIELDVTWDASGKAQPILKEALSLLSSPNASLLCSEGRCKDDGSANRTCFANECLYTGTCPTGSFLGRRDNWLPHPAVANYWATEQWMESIFWAVSATTGIGIDIVPVTNGETAFTTLVIIFGLVWYSILVGSAASALQNVDSASAKKREKLEKIREFLKAAKVPPFFQKVVSDFYIHHMDSRHSQITEGQLMADLPPTLKVRLSLMLKRSIMLRVPFFAQFHVDVFIQLVQMLEAETFLPGEYVIEAGSQTTVLYFIERGEIDIIVPREGHHAGDKLAATLKVGDFFGERGLFSKNGENESLVSARSVDYSDTLNLSQEGEKRGGEPDVLAAYIRRFCLSSCAGSTIFCLLYFRMIQS